MEPGFKANMGCKENKVANNFCMTAVGKYDDSGQLKSGGNIYFGDHRFGTICTASVLLLAASNFMYNSDSVTESSKELETGFSIYGNLNTLNQISIDRDWMLVEL